MTTILFQSYSLVLCSYEADRYSGIPSPNHLYMLIASDVPGVDRLFTSHSIEWTDTAQLEEGGES